MKRKIQGDCLFAKHTLTRQHRITKASGNNEGDCHNAASASRSINSSAVGWSWSSLSVLGRARHFSTAENSQVSSLRRRTVSVLVITFAKQEAQDSQEPQGSDPGENPKDHILGIGPLDCLKWARLVYVLGAS